MKIEPLAIPDVILRHAAAIRRRPRLLLGNLERRPVRRGRDSSDRSCRTITACRRPGAPLRGLHCQIAPNVAGQAGAGAARRHLGRGGRHPARLADLRPARRRRAERRELVPALGARRLPARVLHARAGYRGRLQGDRRLRPGRRARRDLERSRPRRCPGRSRRARRRFPPRTRSCRVSPIASRGSRWPCSPVLSSSPAAAANWRRALSDAAGGRRLRCVGRPEFDFDQLGHVARVACSGRRPR